MTIARNTCPLLDQGTGWLCNRAPDVAASNQSKYGISSQKSTNRNHVLNALDCVLPQFHDAPLDSASRRNMEAWAQVSIFEKATKFWVLCCIERLISCHYPFVKILVKLLLIKCLAQVKEGKHVSTRKGWLCDLHAFVSSAWRWKRSTIVVEAFLSWSK